MGSQKNIPWEGMAIHKVVVNAQLAAKRSHLVFKKTLEGLNQFQLPKSLVKSET